MRVYIPFPDGSSVSFDGKHFSLQNRPLDLDTAAEGRESLAETAWEGRWKDIVQALEAAWGQKKNSQKQARMRQVYSGLPVEFSREGPDLSPRDFPGITDEEADEEAAE